MTRYLMASPATFRPRRKLLPLSPFPYPSLSFRLPIPHHLSPLSLQSLALLPCSFPPSFFPPYNQFTNPPPSTQLHPFLAIPLSPFFFPFPWLPSSPHPPCPHASIQSLPGIILPHSMFTLVTPWLPAPPVFPCSSHHSSPLTFPHFFVPSPSLPASSAETSTPRLSLTSFGHTSANPSLVFHIPSLLPGTSQNTCKNTYL